MTAEVVVVGASAFVACVTVLIIFVTRVRLGRSAGVRQAQFLATGTLVPFAVILVMLDKLDGRYAFSLIVAVGGYLLANISKFDERQR